MIWKKASEHAPPSGLLLVRVFTNVAHHPEGGAWWLGRTCYAVVTVMPEDGYFYFVGHRFPLGSIEIWTELPPEDEGPTQ